MRFGKELSQEFPVGSATKMNPYTTMTQPISRAEFQRVNHEDNSMIVQTKNP